MIIIRCVLESISVVPVLFIEIRTSFLSLGGMARRVWMVEGVFVDTGDGGEYASVLTSVVTELWPVLFHCSTSLSQVLLRESPRINERVQSDESRGKGEKAHLEIRTTQVLMLLHVKPKVQSILGVLLLQEDVEAVQVEWSTRSSHQDVG